MSLGNQLLYEILMAREYKVSGWKSTALMDRNDPELTRAFEEGLGVPKHGPPCPFCNKGQCWQYMGIK